MTDPMPGAVPGTTPDPYPPSVLVVCLAARNAGGTHSAWVDATQRADAIAADIAAMLATSPEPGAEEWAIVATSNLAVPWLIGATDLALVAQTAELAAQYGAEAVAGWADVYCTPTDADDLADFEDAYAGLWPSWREFSDDLADQILGVSGRADTDELARYFDWQAFARDLRNDYGTVKERHGYRIHVYRSV